MTLYLLKVHLQTFFSLPISQKCQILSSDTLVANERYVETLTFKLEESYGIKRHSYTACFYTNYELFILL